MPSYAKIPDFGELVEFITQAEPVVREDGEIYYGIQINKVGLQNIDVIAAAETIKADYEKVAGMRAVEPLKANEIAAVREKIKETYHSDVAALVTATAVPLDIVSALTAVKTYPDWKMGMTISPNQILWYEKNLYQMIQPSAITISDAKWNPVEAKALFKRYYEPDGDPWPWVQPLGAHDAYPIGARVLFDGRVWRSKLAANVWSPAAYPQGWEDLGALAAAPERRD